MKHHYIEPGHRMPRDEARIFSRIWRDKDFRALNGGAQRLYMLALSQSDLNHAGVVPFTPSRWVDLAKDSTAQQIRKDAAILAAARFVVVDEAKAELFIRTHVRNDRVLRQPNVTVAACRAYEDIKSPTIRAAWLVELARAITDDSLVIEATKKTTASERASDMLRTLLLEPLPEGFPEGFPEGLYDGFPQEFWDGFGKPILERFT